jgi:hypothetical protein
MMDGLKLLNTMIYHCGALERRRRRRRYGKNIDIGTGVRF